MALVWKVYYDHWAKDVNSIRKAEYLDRGATKTLKTIWRWFSFAHRDLDQIPLEECLDDLQTTLPMVLPTMFSQKNRIRDQMTYIRELAENLVPLHTPKDQELKTRSLCEFEVINAQFERRPDSCIFAVLPAEERFKKNLNIKKHKTTFFGEEENRFDTIAFLELELSADEMRRLDALLAFLN